ncbi:MAG TPA: DEAD/DEAH box helicase, partial [Longimicrobiales bacterium]|nr:DEAD/DEAH box helicase [Longimicrobiales bacterium]
MTPPGPDPSDTSSPDLTATLVGVDGLEVEPEAPPPADPSRPLRMPDEAAERIRSEIARAGGREVCFLADVLPDRTIANPRAVARGNHAAVLAVARDAPEGGVMIHNHPSGRLDPSDADLSVAARVWEEGLGTAITDNEASELYVVVEPPAPRERTPLDLDRLADLIGPGGPLAARFAGYEDRPGQREMLRLVAERYNEDGIALVEAGTGTGKSLAYLLPAAAWALENEERTVVSTATINLQEQLVGKDLPLVKDMLGGDLTWALVKGRGNYVSIRRARLAMASSAELFPDDRSKELEAIREWLVTTEDGSLADLPAPPSGEVWEEVRSDPDACLRARCPHFQECFFQRSRRKAASARILVVNHHMLFTDVAVRSATGNWTQSAVLPPYAHLVLDEAHNVEDAATENLGASVTQTGMRRVLSRL